MDELQQYQNLETMPTILQEPTILSLLFSVFTIAFVVLLLVAMWRIFTKAGKPGWASLIPFYNSYVLLQIVGRPGWWLLLFFIPLVNIVISLLVVMDLAKAFGKSELFGVVALWLFSVIGYLMLGFGKSKYVGPVHAMQPTSPPLAQPAASVIPPPIT